MNSAILLLKRLVYFFQHRPGMVVLLMLPVYYIFHSIFFQVFYYGKFSAGNFLNEISNDALRIDFSNNLQQSYFSTSIFLSYLSGFIPAFCLAVVLFPLCRYYKRISWKNLEEGNYFKGFIFGITIVLLWFLESYDYNYYLNNDFVADRIILAVFASLVFFHPLFVTPFIVFSLLFKSQFDFPIGGFPLFDVRILFDLLILFSCFLLFRIFFYLHSANFFLLSLCMLASSYFFSGARKLFNSPGTDPWITANNLGDLLTNCSLRGWPITVNFIDFGSKYSALLQIFTLITELSAIFILFQKKISIAILLAIIAMHAGIFAFTGFFFWKWMCVNIFFIILLLSLPKKFLDEIFTKGKFKYSLLIIAFSYFFFGPLKINWHDTPFTQFFRYEAVVESGKVFPLNKKDFKPFDQYFQYDRFHYLVNEKLLPVSGFGYSTYNIAAQVRKANPETIGEMEQTFGKNYFDEEKSEQFDSFIKTYFRNYNGTINENILVNFFSAPSHVMHTEHPFFFRSNEKVVQLRVIFVKYFSINGKKALLKENTIRQINI